jgi:ABC-type multidrug transport system fused ATPase/permease subunit
MPGLPLPPSRRIAKTGDPTPAPTVFAYVWRMSGWHQLAIACLALVVAGLVMVPLELQRRLVDHAIGAGDLDLVITLGSFYLGVVLLAGVAKFALRLYQQWLSESAIRYSRRHLLGVHECRLASRQGGDDGRAVSIIGTEVDQLGGFVGEGLSQIVVNVGMLVAVAGYMFVVDPVVAAVGLALVIPQALAVPLAQRVLNRLTAQRVRLLRRLSDRIANLPTDGDEELARFDPALRRIYANRMRIAITKNLIKGFVTTSGNLGPVVVFLVGGWLVIEGDTTVGIVVAFASGVQRLADPIRELATTVRLVARAGVQHQMIARWM